MSGGAEPPLSVAGLLPPPVAPESQPAAVPSPEETRATFEYDAPKPPAQLGTPVVNGHKILSAESVSIVIESWRTPVVLLKLIAPDALKLFFGEATVAVDDQTREALVSLGWTPPPGDKL